MRVVTICRCFLVVLGAGLQTSGADAQQISAPTVRSAEARTIAAILGPAAPLTKIWQPGDPERVRSDLKGRSDRGQPPPGALQAVGPDPLLAVQSIAGAGAQPSVVVNFPGIPSTGAAPPDIIGAVGPNHYIQMVNASVAIFDKKGKRLDGPKDINTIFKGFGGPCESQNAGDPVVRYDHLANRWLVSQFAVDEHFQCIAISRGPAPVLSPDGWFLYGFPTVTSDGTPITPDYPKVTVWPDGYYMGTQRGFPSDGLDVWVFEREKMLAGQPARQVQFSVGAPSLFLMPSDFDGPAPPTGTPNYFIRHVDGKLFGGQDRLELFELSVNWSDPSKSTFKLSSQVPVAPFSAMLCSDMFSGNCATQPGSAPPLETLPAWIMWRLQYRNFGSHETLVTNHTINVGSDRAGVRWYELRRQGGGAWSKFQEGTHSPDTNHRWMGSIAMDGTGNIALGYSASGPTLFPSIRVATRTPTDPPGTLAGEMTLQEGHGAQTHESARWGDYSSMDVDPAEPCTFWYTNEYYPATSRIGWRTRIASFRIPSCSQ